ncbi:MAG TPA: hypothetical protein VFD98_06455 [Terracidiphilus sp.]|jgi:hypothetical protein|nr:hypothetical protein [Terracidiphilus sp.]
MKSSRVYRRLSLPIGASIFVATVALCASQAYAQGCVAAHSPQPVIAGLDPTSQVSARSFSNGEWIHGLTVTVGYRVYNSYKHFIGTDYQEQRQENHNAIVNHVNLFELDLAYRLTPRNSFIASIPAMTATRHGQASPLNVYRVGGLGDVTLGGQTWVWRPPTESHGNINFSYQLKLPTGINDAQGTKTSANGTKTVQPFDESIQPGDGTWGFSLATEAYREFRWHTSGYFTGSWLFNPQDTTGVKTYRPAPGEDVISATDQYLWRGGFSHPMPNVKVLRGLTLSMGGRMEGVPVRDGFGSSNGFRRPGYVISIEPGMMYAWKRYLLTASGPWAVERNRKTSVTDYANNTHGDAAFSDYTVIVGLTRSF